nr:hypothetical protein [Micromonospora sp. DSM 115978]
LLFIAIPSVVLGRMVSIPLAMVGGLGLGVAQNLISNYTDIGNEIIGFADAVPFIVLFGLLFFFGKEKGRRAGTTLEEKPPRNYLADVGVWRRRAPWMVVTAAVLIYGSFVADDYWAQLLARGLATSRVLLSFTV